MYACLHVWMFVWISVCVYLCVCLSVCPSVCLAHGAASAGNRERHRSNWEFFLPASSCEQLLLVFTPRCLIFDALRVCVCVLTHTQGWVGGGWWWWLTHCIARRWWWWVGGGWIHRTQGLRMSLGVFLGDLACAVGPVFCLSLRV
jgi:hypothetical protein